MQLVGRSFAAGKTVRGNNCPEVALFRNDTALNLLLTLALARRSSCMRLSS